MQIWTTNLHCWLYYTWQKEQASFRSQVNFREAILMWKSNSLDQILPFFPLSFLAQNFHQSQEIICLCLWESTVRVDTFVILNEHSYCKISYLFRNICAFLVQWLKLLHSQKHHYFLSCHSLICAAMEGYSGICFCSFVQTASNHAGVETGSFQG